MIARLFVIGALASAPVNASDLLDVYRQAQANDPTWLAAQAEQRAVFEQVPQARAGLLPSAGFSAETFRNNQHVKTPTVDDTFDFTSKAYALELNQPLYNRERRVQYDQALSGATQAESQLMLARQDLIARTVSAYLAVLNAREALEFARSEKAAVERLLALARRNFNVGAASLIDVHEAQAAYDLAVSQEITAANDLETSRQALRTLTGAEVDELTPLGDALGLVPPDPKDMESWVSQALEQNPTVKIQEQALERTTLEVERSRGLHYPTLDLVAARTHNDVGANNSGVPSETTNNQVGVRFQMSLYSSGQTNARVRETLARRDVAAQQLEAAKRQVSQQARAAYLAVINSIAQVRALEQARASNQRALESTVLGQERGLRSGLDVLTTQRALFRTLRDLANARYNYLLSRVQLAAAAGALTEQNVDELNRLLTTR
jgi:outer membrane protein